MNLWDIKAGKYHNGLLALTAGNDEAKISDLRAKLGDVPESGGDNFGKVSNYFVRRYGFHSECDIIPFTGDNPSTILALPLRPLDAIVSLGTSTTFLMSTPYYKPDPAVHFMNHPTTAGLYMFMLCYKNGESFDSLNSRPTTCRLTALHTPVKYFESLPNKHPFLRWPRPRTSPRLPPPTSNPLQRPLVPIQPPRHHPSAPQRRLAIRAPETGAVFPPSRDRPERLGGNIPLHALPFQLRFISAFALASTHVPGMEPPQRRRARDTGEPAAESAAPVREHRRASGPESG